MIRQHPQITAVGAAAARDVMAALIGRVLTPGWAITGVRATPTAAIELSLAGPRGASLRLLISPPQATEPGRHVLTPAGRLAVREVSGLTASEERDAIRAIARQATEWAPLLADAFPHLALAETTGAEARRRLRTTAFATATCGERRTLRIDPADVAELLAPELSLNGPPLRGYVLRAIYLPLPADHATRVDLRCCTLELTSVDGADTKRFALGPPGAIPREIGRAGALAVGLCHFGEADHGLSPPQAALYSALAALLACKQGPGFTVEVPRSIDELRTLALPAGHSGGGGNAVPGPKWTRRGPVPRLSCGVRAALRVLCAQVLCPEPRRRRRGAGSQEGPAPPGAQRGDRRSAARRHRSPGVLPLPRHRAGGDVARLPAAQGHRDRPPLR